MYLEVISNYIQEVWKAGHNPGDGDAHEAAVGMDHVWSQGWLTRLQMQGSRSVGGALDVTNGHYTALQPDVAATDLQCFRNYPCMDPELFSEMTET